MHDRRFIKKLNVQFLLKFRDGYGHVIREKNVIITKEQKGKFNPIQNGRFYVRSMHGAWGGA